MRNRLLVSAAVLAAGVAVASAQHAPGAGQDRLQAHDHAHGRDVGRAVGQNHRSQGATAGKAAQPRTAGLQNHKGAGGDPQKPAPRVTAKRPVEPARGEAFPRQHSVRSGLLTPERHSETPLNRRVRGQLSAAPADHGARDHARSEAARRSSEQGTGRAGERETKRQTRNVRVHSAEPPSPPPRDGTPHTGQADIRSVQTALNQQGFNVGDPDGKLGRRTKEALIAFQKQHGFQRTGKVDRATLEALNAGGGAQGGVHGANKPGTDKDTGRGQTPAQAAPQPQDAPAQPATTGQGGTPGPAEALPQPVEGERPTAQDGLQLPDASSRVPAGAPQEDYKDDALPPGGDQR